MNKFQKIGLLGAVLGILFSANSIAAPASPGLVLSLPSALNLPKSLQGAQLAHDVGYGHYHGRSRQSPPPRRRSGRIRSYHYCSENAYKPCRRAGGTYRECNREHHLCTYGHTRNCIPGRTC